MSATPSEAVICDASVLAAMVFGEPGSAVAHSLTRGRRLLAPGILRYEMAHIAVRKCAAAEESASFVEAAFARSLRVPVRLVGPSWPAVFQLARGNRLSAYDASYLQLALTLHVPLATLDKRLGQVAESLGIRASPRAG